jgi:hypothetical protein
MSGLRNWKHEFLSLREQMYKVQYALRRRGYPETPEGLDAALNEIDSLRRDLEAARVDAERYRHIKAEWAIVRDFFPNRWHISTPYIYGDSFDAAIDLARARGEGNDDE